MKFSIPFSASSRGDSSATSGFTLPEMLIALAVFMLLLVGIIAANLFGLRMFQINQTKLSATEWSRNTFGKITDEIHSCNTVSVGNMTITTNSDMTINSDFEPLSLPGETQEGNALQIYPTTNTDSFTMYFVNFLDETFRQTVGIPGVSTNTIILADSVTNTIIFSAQDFSGNVLTNSLNNQIIHLTLEFYQPAYFMVGPNNYKLETSVSRRAVQ
jgi:prepilin-type N-terminal cleavage/methylation domain-containing protein